ncbi:hypothetical protein Poli38472_002544 [Pythium oligandrum]|uniref:Uncharacterized protein n=1 Tax=Pythium oligandrum TaxID=41045 RepID=A0A8K1CIJ4_PYTOL|nr:hypothetical protein Poli38472_002544 [Pythium oligandrum]|eukprot:TMW63603.1 hypothetical protein Poli38472_002544 [Pythium oligandrum]
MLPAPPASNIVTNPIPAAASVTTGNVYHALSARKSAEETAKQLARRIAHFRAQEERVLREVQHMKQRLEFLLSPREEAVDESTAVATPVETPRGNSSRSRRPLSAAAGSQRSPRLEPKTPRSREQLQFLNKQRRIIQIRKLESARQQKERRKMALDAQRQKEEAEQERRAALKERIRLQQQQALELRAAKQHQQLESLEHQHYDRLRTEQLLEQHARSMIDEMREEEKNLALRLQALQVHQEHIKRSLEGGQQSASVRPAAPTSSAPTEANPMAAMEMELERRLTHFLTALTCPAFLHATRERLQSGAFRRTLCLWLYAVYHQPELRKGSDEQWTRNEPTPERLTRWLQMLGVGNESECLRLVDETTAWDPRMLRSLLLVIETVHGRVMIEERGEGVVLDETMALLRDVVTHQDAVFDGRCDIFPLSIQMISNDTRSDSQSGLAGQLEADISTLERQLETLKTRITSARDRLDALHTVALRAESTGPKDSKTLSQELGNYLTECVNLIERTKVMLQDEIACWLSTPQPKLVGLGQAAAAAYDGIGNVLQFLETTQSFSTAGRNQRKLEATQDVTSYCQDLVESMAPGFREQLQVLETALQVYPP